MTHFDTTGKGLRPQDMGKPLPLLHIIKAVNHRTALEAILTPLKTLHIETLSDIQFPMTFSDTGNLTGLGRSEGQEGGSPKGLSLSSSDLQALSFRKDEGGHLLDHTLTPPPTHRGVSPPVALPPLALLPAALCKQIRPCTEGVSTGRGVL